MKKYSTVCISRMWQTNWSNKRGEFCCNEPIRNLITQIRQTRTKMKQTKRTNERGEFCCKESIRNRIYDANKADPHEDEAKSITTIKCHVSNRFTPISASWPLHNTWWLDYWWILMTSADAAWRITTGVLENFMNINYLRNIYLGRVTYLTTPTFAL